MFVDLKASFDIDRKKTSLNLSEKERSKCTQVIKTVSTFETSKSDVFIQSAQ